MFCVPSGVLRRQGSGPVLDMHVQMPSTRLTRLPEPSVQEKDSLSLKEKHMEHD
jgi:hypothetical protein